MARSQARCVVLACCAAVGAAQTLTNGLTHSWCFGQFDAGTCNLKDTPTGSMDATMNAYGSGMTCVDGEGLTFDGNSCASLAAAQIGGDPMTIAVWPGPP